MPAEDTFFDSLILLSTDNSGLTEHLLQMRVWVGLLLGCFSGAGLARSPALSRGSGLLWWEHSCLGSLDWRGPSC